MGSQDRDETWIRTESLQSLQPVTGRTTRTGQILKGTSGQGVYQTVTIPNGIAFLLCQKERWKASTLPRLQIPERLDNQKRLSLTTNLGNPRSNQERQILHQI